MRRLVQQGKTNPSNRDLAARIIARVPAKDWIGELRALFDWVQANIRYTLDPNDLETIQGAAATIALGYGDCDDMTVLLSTLCECVGHQTAFMALGFTEPGEFSHVLVIASGAGELPWLSMDPTEPRPFGWFPPNPICEMLCPITQAAQISIEQEYGA